MRDSIIFVTFILPVLSFDGEYFHATESSEFSHWNVLGLGNYRGQALTTGCGNGYSDVDDVAILVITR